MRRRLSRFMAQFKRRRPSRRRWLSDQVKRRASEALRVKLQRPGPVRRNERMMRDRGYWLGSYNYRRRW